MLSVPQKSRVLRTVRRWKNSNIAAEENARPDYQEVLTQIRFVVILDEGLEPKMHPGDMTLVERVIGAIEAPMNVDRFGGLSLGESRDLVDVVARDETSRPMAWILREESDGAPAAEFAGSDLTLPLWVDHVGSRGTVFQDYRAARLASDPEPDLWTVIRSN